MKLRLFRRVQALCALMPIALIGVLAAGCRVAPVTSCAFAPGADAKSIGPFLDTWARDSGLVSVTGWGGSVDKERARIEIRTPSGNLDLELRLGADCANPPTVRVLASTVATESAPNEAALARLAQGLPAPRVQLEQHGVDHDQQQMGALRLGPVLVAPFSWLAGLYLVVIAAAARRPSLKHASARTLTAVWVLALLVLAAWPIFPDSFDSDAPVLRAAYARADVFGDWNHPFLPYLLNRPAARLSLEPEVLRAIPFLALCMETLLLVAAAHRSGGPLAGALAGAFFACEVRRRHGLVDLGDWDFAGAFLVAWLLWILRLPGEAHFRSGKDSRVDLEWGWSTAFRRRMRNLSIFFGPAKAGTPTRDPSFALLALLLLAGAFSSWLMIVPAAVLVGCLWLEVLGGRLPRRPVLMLTVVFGLAAWAALGVFRLGAGASIAEGPTTVAALFREMYVETPVGRSLWMLIPCLLGLAWLARGRDRLANRFVGLSLLSVPIALTVALLRSHINGGYYVGLVTPLGLYATAVGTAIAIDSLAARVTRSLRPLPIPVAAAAITAVLVTAAVFLSPFDRRGDERMADFAGTITTNALSVYTNSPDLPLILSYERLRRGDERGLAEILSPQGTAEQRQRIRPWDAATCASPADAASEFYLVVNRFGSERVDDSCLASTARGCRDLYPDPTAGKARFRFLHCGSSARMAEG